MAKYSFSSDSDQNDAKTFRESLGSFGTTTAPGADQLLELQTKVKQGVKHVELHLGSSGKGQFGAQDVPDKYGFEQRRTIMQLAKMNKQTLSVHGTFEITSFSGLGQGGFDETTRLKNLKEIDETVKFAAETAKSGAIVFHIQGDALNNERGELNISRSYLDWLEEKAKTDDKYKAELENLEKNYFNSNRLKRQFVNNPENLTDVQFDLAKLKEDNFDEYKKIVKSAKENGVKVWEEFYNQRMIDELKLSPAKATHIMVGEQMSQVNRQEDVLNIDVLKNGGNLTSKDKDVLSKIGVDVGVNFDIEDFQKAQAVFTNGKPAELEISNKEFLELKKKVLTTYESLLDKNNNILAHADEEFLKKQLDSKLKIMDLQKENIVNKYDMHREEIERINLLEKEAKDALNKAKLLDSNDKLSKEAKAIIKEDIAMKNQEIQQLIGQVGYQEYQELKQANEMIANINKQKQELKKQKDNVRAVTDVSFDKNVTGMGHLGVKALKYQLELKQKADRDAEKSGVLQKEVEDLMQDYQKAQSNAERNEINSKLIKKKYELRNVVGMQDYQDIDLINNPLYLAPENMLPGMGSLTSLEEYKAVVRMAQEDFAKRILSGNSEYKDLKESYEKVTGTKIESQEDAIKLAKRHLGGTFDNAHAAVWLKHFRRKEGETDEQRLDVFNDWLNTQAEEMYKEGLIKHVHFNDTNAKDDDHNLVGTGVLDVVDLQDRLRNLGMKEALIVEAGGRGADKVLHLQSAFEIFNPTLQVQGNYRFNSTGTAPSVNSGVSDWMSVQRDYIRRPQYSSYGMSQGSFNGQLQQGQQGGDWSGTSFF